MFRVANTTPILNTYFSLPTHLDAYSKQQTKASYDAVKTHRPSEANHASVDTSLDIANFLYGEGYMNALFLLAALSSFFRYSNSCLAFDLLLCFLPTASQLALFTLAFTFLDAGRLLPNCPIDLQSTTPLLPISSLDETPTRIQSYVDRLLPIN